jgi:hypothetical protein
MADGAFGELEQIGGFLGGAADEEAEFDDLNELGVELFEVGEGVFDVDEGGHALLHFGAGFGEGEVVLAFGGEFAAGVIDEDLPHGAAGGVDEVFAALPAIGVGVDELQVGFVDEGGGLERVGVAGAEIDAGEAPEIFVDRGDAAEFRIFNFHGNVPV